MTQTQTTQTAATKTTLVYEIGGCSRCGGSGTYSYCQMYGTTCFKCRGRKQTLTKAGAKAAAAVDAFKRDHFSAAVETLAPGMRIMFEGVARTVESVTLDGSGSSTRDGVTTTYARYTVTVTKPVKSQFGAYRSLGVAAGTMFVRAVSGADWDAVVTFARTLKGVTVVETPAAD